MFFFITCKFDVCHYLMILCLLDQMNDKMMFSLSIESILFVIEMLLDQ